MGYEVVGVCVGVGLESVAAMVMDSVTSGPRGANLRELKFAGVGFSSAFGCKGVEVIPKTQIGGRASKLSTKHCEAQSCTCAFR